MAIPQCITVGDDVDFDVQLRNYDGSAGAVAVVHFVNTDKNYKINGQFVGPHFSFRQTAEQTYDYEPGMYDLFLIVSLDGQRKTIARKKLQILPDPTDGAGDFRTDNEIMLEAIIAMLKGKATADQQQYTIDGQMMTRYRWDELEALKDKYQRLVDRERAQSTGASVRARNMKVRMR